VKKLALVTGGASGIGLAVSRLLAEDHDLAIAYASNQGRAEAVRRELEARTTVRIFGGRLRTYEDAQKLIAGVTAAFGHVPDVLVNSIGEIGGELFVSPDFGKQQQMIEEHLLMTMSLCHLVVGRMYRERFGRIVSIGSIAGRFAARGQAGYAAAKAGVEGFSRALALEVAHRGVTVNVVAAGLIDTPLTQPFLQMLKERNLDISRGIPAGKLGKPEEVAEVVKFLCSERAGYITGAVYTIDGGRSLGNPHI